MRLGGRLSKLHTALSVYYWVVLFLLMMFGALGAFRGQLKKAMPFGGERAPGYLGLCHLGM